MAADPVTDQRTAARVEFRVRANEYRHWKLALRVRSRLCGWTWMSRPRFAKGMS